MKKSGKRILSMLLALLMILSLLPFSALAEELDEVQDVVETGVIEQNAEDEAAGPPAADETQNKSEPDDPPAEEANDVPEVEDAMEIEEVLDDDAVVLMDVDGGGAVAMIGDAEYTTLAAAITAAQDGDTVKIINDFELTSMITINKSIIVDGQNHSVTLSNNVTRGTSASPASSTGLYVTGSNVEIKDINLEISSSFGTNNAYNNYGAIWNAAQSLTLSNVTVKVGTGNDYRTAIFNFRQGATISISNSVLEAKYVIGLNADDATLSIENSTAAAGWSIISTHKANNTVRIDGCTLTSTNINNNSDYNAYAMFWFKEAGEQNYANYNQKYLLISRISYIIYSWINRLFLRMYVYCRSMLVRITAEKE